MSDPENLTLDKMWEAVEALKAKMPPRTEIWVTQHLPYNPNEDTILEIDTDKVNIRDMTVTNADRVLMMSVGDYYRLTRLLDRASYQHPRPEFIQGTIGGIPVYFDDGLVEYWKAKRPFTQYAGLAYGSPTDAPNFSHYHQWGKLP